MWKGYEEYMTANLYLGIRIPCEWEEAKVLHLFDMVSDKNHAEEELLSVYLNRGVVKYTSTSQMQVHKPSEDLSNYQLVKPGDFAMNHMDLLTGYIDISRQFGVTSPDYRVFVLTDTENCYAPFFLRVFQVGYKRRIFYKFGKGAAQQGRWRLPASAFYDYAIQVPPVEEQKQIAKQCDVIEEQIDEMIEGIRTEISLVEELRTKLISDVVTGQVDVRDITIPDYETEADEDSDEETSDDGTEE